MVTTTYYPCLYRPDRLVGSPQIKKRKQEISDTADTGPNGYIYLFNK
jgi:hypothetical protein